MAKPKLIAIDVETSGLDWKIEKLHGLGVAFEEDETAYYAANEIPGDVLDLLADKDVAKVGQNLRFDLKFLEAAGIKVLGQTYDTKILASLVDENSPQGLKDLALKHLGPWALSDKRELDRAIDKAGVKHVGQLCALDLADPKHPYFEIIARYCEEDCNNTYKLAFVLGEKLREVDRNWKSARGATLGPSDYFKSEATPLEPVLLEMELKGIRINYAAIEALEQKLGQEKTEILERLSTAAASGIKTVEEILYEKAVQKRKSPKGKEKVERSSDKYGTSFSWTSNSHLGLLLYRALEAPERKTEGGNYATAEKDLLALQASPTVGDELRAVLEGLSDFRRVEKLLSTYIGEEKGLVSRLHKGRLYPNYLQVGSSKEEGKGGTVTGRLSSQDPNIQNIPRGAGVKKFFVPDPGKVFVYADYSQLELRLAAHLSQDPELVGGYVSKTDLHLLTASQIFRKSVRDVTKEERQVGKTINFAMIYDAGVFRLMEELNKGGASFSPEQVKEMRVAFFQQFKRYKQYLSEQKAMLVETGALISETGRVRRIPDVNYGKYLDWARKRFTGPDEMRVRLLQGVNEALSDEELFWRASKKFNHAIKQGYNFPIQSLGASITKRAMIALHEAGADITTSVHDSIIIQVDKNKATKAARKMQQIMETTYVLSVPLVAETKIVQSFDETDVVNFEPDNTNNKLDSSPNTGLTLCGSPDNLNNIEVRNAAHQPKTGHTAVRSQHPGRSRVGA